MSSRAGELNASVSSQAHASFVWLAEVRGVSLQAALDEAIEAQRRQLLLEQTNTKFAALHSSAEGAAYLVELHALKATLDDGLD